MIEQAHECPPGGEPGGRRCVLITEASADGEVWFAQAADQRGVRFAPPTPRAPTHLHLSLDKLGPLQALCLELGRRAALAQHHGVFFALRGYAAPGDNCAPGWTNHPYVAVAAIDYGVGTLR